MKKKKTTWDVFRTKEKAQECFNICKQCDEYQPLLKSCKKCGCLIPVKVKIISLHCPIDKW